MSRPSAHQRGYTKDWSRAAKVYLAENPLCLHCYKLGRFTAATQVDHIRPHKGDKELFWDVHNWQPLCHSCHSVKTNTQDKGKALPGVGADGVPIGGWLGE